ncbi:MAG: hypothetical protein JWO38_1486 [Gemmataceae bacterium]|nr:hypothetical protein [Gemmataceae bacterium]
MSEHPEHRLREHLIASVPAVLTATPSMGAFVPCPCPVIAAFGLAQQSFIAEVYRLAREMTEAQLRKPARPFPPAFSLN